MRLFVCSDIHMATENLERLLSKAGLRRAGPGYAGGYAEARAATAAQAGEPIDAVLFAGDLTNWGSRADAQKVFSCFGDKPVYTIPGNLDTSAVLEAMEEQTLSVHGQTAKLGDWAVIGFGGGSPENPGDILFKDSEILEGLEPLLKHCDPPKTILLTHQPPANTKLDLVRGAHVGSKAVRILIEKYQPAFHFCGHIHESWGEDRIEKSRCHNVAAVKEGRASVLDLKTLTVKRLSL